MKIALGVTGGIAAYKAAEIVRLLQDRGVRVQVVMTEAAQEFVRPLTFAALSGEKVITGMFSGATSEPNLDSAVEHIAVAQSIDALLVAPATADILAKFAQGIANDFLSTLYLATKAPVIVAPAMNVNMWEHPATRANLEILRQRGVQIVEPDSGYLACGMIGAGRLADPEHIVAATLERLGVAQDLAGETVLVTAGPTHEPVDPVRYIGNRSSGKMGYALAEAALRRGAKVVLVSGPTALTPPSAAETIFVETAQQMRTAVLDRWEKASIIIMAAAVADYHVKNAVAGKDQAQRADGSAARAEPRHPRRSGQPAARQRQEHAAADRLRRRNHQPAGERARQAGEEARGRDRAQRCRACRHRLQLRPQRGHGGDRATTPSRFRRRASWTLHRKFSMPRSAPAATRYTGAFTGP